MSSDHTADQPTPAGSATKEIRVYLEGLIREFDNAGFRTGLIVERDGYSEHLWFKGGRNGYCAFPLKPTLQREAEQDADRIWTTHVGYMNAAASEPAE